MTDPSPGSYSVFAGTMADMTYPEVEAAAKRGAIVLWAMGVIEQHGPHLPLATDVYIPTAVLRGARRLLGERGIDSVIAPPFYWGVNDVSASFPGTFKVRPEIMVELMKDVFATLAGDGFRRVFCLSGHGDAAHNRTIYRGVIEGCDGTNITGHFVLPPGMRARLGLPDDDPRLVSYDERQADAPHFLDIHAGEYETAALLSEVPDTCRRDLVPTLKSTDLTRDDLAIWRQGPDAARRVTPHGYFGDPAAARPDDGARLLAHNARAVADSITAVMKVDRG